MAVISLGPATLPGTVTSTIQKADPKAIAQMAMGMMESFKDKERLCALVYGTVGSGKTRLISTAVAPIHIFQFDPDGAETIRKEVAKGRVTVDAFEYETPEAPHLLKDFERRFEELKYMGFFEPIQTIALDSLTTLSHAVMMQVQKDLKRVGKNPTFDEYNMHSRIIQKIVRELQSTGKDVIITAHDGVLVDENMSVYTITIDLYKNLKKLIPLLFSEIYYIKSVLKGGKRDVTLTLIPDNMVARSRADCDGMLGVTFQADIKALKKAVGKTTFEDQTLLKDLA